MFYKFTQNNSGGGWSIGDNVARYVIIEANHAKHANSRAKSLGIYFDGVSKGIDCLCCGDRWHEAYENNYDNFDDMEKVKIEIWELVGYFFSAYSSNSYPFCILHLLNGDRYTFYSEHSVKINASQVITLTEFNALGFF